MNSLQFPRFARPALPAHALDTVESGGRVFFARDIEALVLQACRAQGLGFDLFATRFNVPKPALLEILRGNEPVGSHTRRILEDFVARALGRGDGAARIAAAQSALATRSDRL